MWKTVGRGRGLSGSVEDNGRRSKKKWRMVEGCGTVCGRYWKLFKEDVEGWKDCGAVVWKTLGRCSKMWRMVEGVCLFVGCLTSQQHASVSQGRICSDNFTCCHTEIEVAHPTFYLTQSQYTHTGPTSPSADPITPGAWQGSHRSANF